MGGFAWVTLATNDSYSLGALVLAHSLKQAGTAHQLAVLVTPGVTSAMREKLANVFNVVQEVNILDSRDEANLKLLKRPELGITFTKLHCWRLTQFDKCVFLDADTLVLQNSDELFEREELSAAPDVGWPDCFNSGVFVYRPALDTFEKLVQFALEKGSFDGGDQGLLNLYFSDWAHKDISKHLPFIYNMCSTACYSYLPAFKQFGDNAKIIHFIGAQKPWLQYFNTETKKVHPSGDSTHLQAVLQRWWDIFCSLIHPHLSPAMPDQSQHGMSPSYFPPQYDPPPNPVASADYYENAWDPWDEYDKKIALNTHHVSAPTHFNQNQPTESQNTNASSVANQPTIHHSQPQMPNYNTFSIQNNSYNQPPASQASDHMHRVPTPPPSPNAESHNQQHYHHPEPQSQHSEPYIEIHHQEYHHDHTQNHDQFQYNENKEESYSDINRLPEHPRTPPPPPPNPDPILPKECKPTSTNSNMPLNSTIEDNSMHENAGLAAAFSQLTLGVPRTTEQDALENVLRKQAWEVGNIDYAGKDSFDNIWEKISQTLSSESSQGPPPSEPKPAPVETQSQTATQEEAPPQSQVSPPEILTDKSSQDSPKVDSLESSSPVEVKKEPQISPATKVVEMPSTPEQPKIETVTSTCQPQVATEPIKVEPVKKDIEPAVLKSEPVTEAPSQIGEEAKAAPVKESAAVEPKPALSREEPQPVQEAAPVKSEPEASLESKAEPVEPPKLQPVSVEAAVEEKVSPKAVEQPASDKALEIGEPKEPPKKDESQTEPKQPPLVAEQKAGVIEPKSETAQAPIEVVSDPVCPLSPKKDSPKPSEETPAGAELNQPPAQAPIEVVPDPICPLPPKKDSPKPLEEIPAGAELKQTPDQAPIEVVSDPVCPLLPKKDPPKPLEETAAGAELKQPLQETKQTETPAAPDTKEAAPSSESSAAVIPKKETLAAAAPELDISKAAASPETKVTEPTPPTTPSSPPLEKTKQALSAEAKVPETPPPSEGGSTPTPPPRKTDKPKKAAAKPKK